MKKIIYLSLLFIICCLGACKPKLQKIYTVGDAYFLESKQCYITLSSVQAKPLDDTYTQLILEYKIEPENSILIDGDTIFVGMQENPYSAYYENGEKVESLAISESTVVFLYFTVPTSPYFEKDYALLCSIYGANFKISTKAPNFSLWE